MKATLSATLAGVGFFAAVGFLATTARAQVNSWAHPTNGVVKWEDGTKWSLGIPPAAGQSVFITNGVGAIPRSRFVTIDATTSGSFPGTMAVNNLTVAVTSPGIGNNTLLLNNAGSATPVHISNSLTISRSGTLSITNSILRVDAPSGDSFFDDGNVILNSGSIIVGGISSNFSSALNIGSQPGATGAVLVTGGQLIVTGLGSVENFITIGHVGAAGQMTVSGGACVGNIIDVGAFGSGTLTISGGTTTLSSFLDIGLGATGTVWVTGGQLTVTNNTTYLGSSGTGLLTVSNGTWRAREVYVGWVLSSRGTLTLAGGASSVSSNMTLGNFACTSTGIVNIVGGELDVTNATGTAVLEVRSGSVILDSGTLTVDQLVITNACAHFVHTGGMLVYGNLTLDPNGDTDGDGFSNQLETDVGTDPLDPSSFPNPVNSWTDSANGAWKWETGTNWSLSIPPAHYQSVFITNGVGGISDARTVMIDATTAGSFPGTMTVSNLTVGVTSPGVGTNTLFLNNTGSTTPLLVTSRLTVNANGALSITNGRLDLTGLLMVGENGNGQVTASDSTLNLGGLRVDGGTFSFGGGTAIVNGSPIEVGITGGTGTVWITGGDVNCPSSLFLVPFGGVGQMVVSNGTLRCGRIGVGAFPSSVGTLTLAGGTISLSGDFTELVLGAGTGSIWVTSGFLGSTNLNNGTFLFLGTGGSGLMTVSGGVVQLDSAWVGDSNGSGVLNVNGGDVTIRNNLTLGRGGCAGTNIVNVVDGELDVGVPFGVLEINNGTLTQSGGVLSIGKLVITNACGHFIHTGGTLNAVFSPVLGPNLDADGDGIPNGYEQSHGLDPLNPINATKDSDGDGLSDLQEFQAGTDPTNSASFFGVTAITPAGNDLRVTWMTGLGKTNALERSPGAADGGYSNNFAAIFTVTNTVGSVTNYTDIGGATNKPARYYRVHLVP
jgi:Bacterial TSP3 repeat